MELAAVNRPRRQYSLVENSSSDLEQRQIDAPIQSSPKASPMNAFARKPSLSRRAIMVLPLVFHAVISIVIAFVMISPFNGSRYALSRHPSVTLANGTSVELDGYRLLQSEITTLLSVSLVILRWVAAAWAGPLCWRVICLLGESHGVRRQDVRWASTRGVLPPGTNFKHPLALILGVVLAVSALPPGFAPLLTGSIVWQPSFQPLSQINGAELSITTSGSGDRDDPGIRFEISPTSQLTLLAQRYMTAWGNNSYDLDSSVSRRVLSSISGLGINSTIGEVNFPHLEISAVEWFQTMPNEMERLLNSTLYPNLTSDSLLNQSVSQPGWVWIAPVGDDTSLSNSWYLVTRYSNSPDPCEETLISGKCYAKARVSYKALTGFSTARVISQSVVQNSTNLRISEEDKFISSMAARDLPKYISYLAVLASSLPLPTVEPALFVAIFLSRAHSAVWNTYVDTLPATFTEGTLTAHDYKPALPILEAQVNMARVLTWLCVQLAATFAGLAFLVLQSRSKHPLIGDTAMIAFDMDSTDAPRPSFNDKSEPTSLFRIQPDGDRWKVVMND